MALITTRWMTDIFIVFVILLSFIYLYITRNFNYWKKKRIAYEIPIPILGTFKDVFLFRISPGEYLADMYRKSKGMKYYGLFAFDKPYLLIRDLELIKSILIKDFNYFHDRGVADNKKGDPLGTYNLFTVKNPDWKILRTKLSPVFSSGKIKSMFGLINDVGNDLNEYLVNDIVKRESAEAKEVCAKYTTDVVTTCAFGIRSNCLGDENSPFRLAGKRILTFTWGRAVQFVSYFFAPELVKLFGLRFIDSQAANFLRKVFNESLEHREKTGIKRNDLIDTLIDIKRNDQSMQDDKLVAQATIFLSAGFESSSSVISFTLYELCRNQEIQTKLRNEIRTVLAKHNNYFSYDLLSEMTYLDMVVSETLRKYPPLPFLDRRCMQDYKIPGTNVVLDKGTAICIPLLGLHYDPEYFPDPQKYDPQRFSPENRQKLLFGSYMPFGVGPHNCIGERFGLMSSKIGLIRILSKFEVESVKNTPEFLDLDPKGFLVTSKQGLHMKFKSISILAA